MLYTAKGTAALLVPLANVVSRSGDWHAVLGWAPRRTSPRL